MLANALGVFTLFVFATYSWSILTRFLGKLVKKIAYKLA